MKQPLWETMVDLMSGALPPVVEGELVRVTGVSLDVPIEVALHQGSNELELLGQLPRWRWSTLFDDRRSRLKVVFRETGTGA